MGIDLSRFKVVYGDRVLKVLSLQEVNFGDNVDWNKIHKKPKFIEVLMINENCNIEAIRDEAYRGNYSTI